MTIINDNRKLIETFTEFVEKFDATINELKSTLPNECWEYVSQEYPEEKDREELLKEIGEWIYTEYNLTKVIEETLEQRDEYYTFESADGYHSIIQLDRESEENKDVLFLDGKDEKFGYGVYNTHENCFVALPSGGESGRLMTQDHLTRELDEDILKEIAEWAGLEEVKHLRVVRVHLDNTMDRSASEYYYNNAE